MVSLSRRRIDNSPDIIRVSIGLATGPAAQLGKEHCNFIIYKNPDDVPERYYKRVGREKPKPGA